MECPFCAEDFNEKAVACRNCGRDLRLVLPLIEENLALAARIEELQLQINSARAALARATAPFRFWFIHNLVYVIAPIVLLMTAHYLITVVLDTSPLYLRIASILIPLPFGFSLLWFSHHGIRWSILEGIAIGLISVAGMLSVVAFIDNVPILPESFRDWRETIEYAVSIALAEVTGAEIAMLARRMLPRTLDATGAPGPVAIMIAKAIGRHVGDRTLRRRAQKIQDNFRTIATAIGALGAAAGSIYTGVRALVGGF